MKQLVIIAAGGLGREAAAVVERLSEWELIGFLDDAPELLNQEVAGLPVLGGLDAVQDHLHVSLVVCAGKGQARRSIVARLRSLGVTDDRFVSVISPDVHIPKSCSVGVGSVLLSGTVLTSDVLVGSHVVTMPGVVLTHDNDIGDYATLCAQATIGGNVTVGEAAYLGMGSMVREQVHVGAESILGMGATLLQDLPAGETWVGTPARTVRHGFTTKEKVS